MAGFSVGGATLYPRSPEICPEASCRRSAPKHVPWVHLSVKLPLIVCTAPKRRTESGMTPLSSQLPGSPTWASPSVRLNATMRQGSLIGLRMQHVLSRLNVREENGHRQKYGERDGVGREHKRGHGTPHWMRGRNEEHPKRRTSGGRVALLWKQLGMTSHILAVRENDSKHLSAHILGGERRPMFARSTSLPVISVRDITC